MVLFVLFASVVGILFVQQSEINENDESSVSERAELLLNTITALALSALRNRQFTSRTVQFRV